MAVFVLTDASLTVNSVDLSTYVNSITLNYERDAVSIDAMGMSGHQFTGGMQNISLDVTFNQDFAATKVAATLEALGGTQTTIVVKPTSGAVSATNPSYTISNAYCGSTQPVVGSTGDLAQMSWSAQGGTLVKATS